MSDAVMIIKTRFEKSPTDLREQLPRVVDVRRVLHGVRRDIRAVRNAHHGLPALLQPPRGCLEECAAADQLAQVLQIFRYFSQAGQIYILRQVLQKYFGSDYLVRQILQVLRLARAVHPVQLWRRICTGSVQSGYHIL